MRESLGRVGRFDPQRARNRFLSSFSPPHTRHILLAGEKVGFFVIKPEKDGLVLDHLYVKPGHQGQGVGAAALAEVFARADRAAQPIRVGALRGSNSNRFYLRHGFVLVEQAEFDNYYVRRAANSTDSHGSAPAWQRVASAVLAVAGIVALSLFWISALAAGTFPSWPTAVSAGLVAPYGVFLFAHFALRCMLPGRMSRRQ